MRNTRRGVLAGCLGLMTGLAGCTELVGKPTETPDDRRPGTPVDRRPETDRPTGRVFVSEGVLSFRLAGATVYGQVGAGKLSASGLNDASDFDAETGRFNLHGRGTQEIRFAEGTLSALTVIAESGAVDVLYEGQLLDSGVTKFERTFERGEVVTETPSDPGEALGRRVWPVASDAPGGQCRANDGERLPATGEEAANYFEYGGCGTWKEYPATPGDAYQLQAKVDGRVLSDAVYEIREPTDGGWETAHRVEPSLEPNDVDGVHTYTYVAESGRFRVRNVDSGRRGTGFYMDVYEA